MVAGVCVCTASRTTILRYTEVTASGVNLQSELGTPDCQIRIILTIPGERRVDVDFKVACHCQWSKPQASERSCENGSERVF